MIFEIALQCIIITVVPLTEQLTKEEQSLETRQEKSTWRQIFASELQE
jgi:hypothetical protein